MNPALEVEVAIWTSLHAAENVVLWYLNAGAPPKKCGEGSFVLRTPLGVIVVVVEIRVGCFQEGCEDPND